MKRLEMVMGNVNCDRLYVTQDRLWVLDCEIQERAASVSAELEISVLDKILYNPVRIRTPLLRSADDRKADRSVKS